MTQRPDPFAAWSSLSPVSFWQDYWHFWSGVQQSMMQQWMTGLSALGQMGAGGPASASGLPAWPLAGMPNLVDFARAGGLSAFMPHVDAVVTPLETKGALAGAQEAARLSMRMAFPGCIGPAEMLLVEAVIARAPAEVAQKLTQSSRDLLPKQGD